MIELLVCKIKNLKIGIEMDKIIEIVEEKEITKLPISSKILKGMFNLRGNILPFFDIEEILFNEKEERKFNYFIIAESKKGRKIGVGIDEIVESIKIETMPSKSAPNKISEEIKKNFLKGIFEKEGEFIYILDLENLMEREDV